MARIRTILQSIANAFKLLSVEPYIFFCLFADTVRQTTLQDLLIDSSCRNLHLYPEEICNDIENHTEHQDASIAAGNNLYSGIMLFCCLPAIIVAIFLGPWSDKYSRKYPLMIASFGQLVESSISASLSFFPNVSPIWYVVASVFSGFSGSFIMSLSAAFSYMADVTDERSRPARYAVLEFFNIAAVVLGSSLGGQIYKAASGGHQVIMILSPCSFAASILYTALVVKETKTRMKDQKCSNMVRDLITTENLKESYRTCSKKRPGNIRLQIWLLVWAACSQKFIDMGTIAIAFPFARKMYRWDVTDFSLAGTTFYVVYAFSTVVIVPILANKLRLHEAALGLIGMLSLTSKMIITSVAYSVPFFYYAFICGALNNAAGIAIRSRLSKLVSKDELGRAFSLLATCESVTPLLGALAFAQIYNASLNFFPGLPFAFAAIFLIPCIIIFGWMIRLPTVSLGDYAKEDEKKANDLQAFSTNYVALEEERF